VLAFSAVGALGTEWQPMTAIHVFWLAGAVVSIVGGYLLSVTSMRVGETAVVAPFRYSSLVVALLLGFLVFGEWPDNVTLLGACIVVATGLFTIWRESRARPNVLPGARLR
jgi:S-adenosylmethionine uptake transporter